MKKIGIVTADFNGHKDTLELLGSLEKQNLKDFEVLKLVVDNGSSESVKKTIEKYTDVVWLQTGKNLGFAGGYNRGIKYVKEWGADFVFLINNDTLFPDNNTIASLVKVLEDNKNAGVVSPKIKFAPGYEFYKDKYSKKDIGNVLWYAGGGFDWDNVKSVHFGIDEVDHGQFDNVEKTDFVSGCSLLVKRDVLEKVGYLEEKLFAYYEDNDWQERVKKAGYDLLYNGKTYIYHKVSGTAKIGSSFSDYLITRNRLWFGIKYATLKTKFALLREAVKFILIGRPAQKEGIFDYFRGVWGWKNVQLTKKVEYPLKLSIIVINYKTRHLTLQLLKSIYNKKSGFDKNKHEVIVLDNSPEDSVQSEVRARYPFVKFIQNSVNNGFAAGNNQMIDFALGENILLLNSDIEVREKGITNILKAKDTINDRAIYSGKLFFPDGKLQDSCFKLPTPLGAFKEYFLRQKGNYFMFSPLGKKIERVEGAVMACFLIPKTVIDEIGKLEEDTFMYFEDIEYCRRAMKNNIPVFYVPTAEFVHHHGQSSKKAGVSVSTERLIEASKWYHGFMEYWLVTAILWAGQKWGKVTTPASRWEKEK